LLPSAADSVFKTTQLATSLEQYVSRGCEGERKLLANLAKHTQEISRMQSSQYQDLTLCVEAALTIMRLSCEQYFTLISVFAAYLFFRQRPPPVARRVVWLNHRVSTIFKKVRKGPISQSVKQPINQSINQCISQSINQSIIQSINQSINQSFNQSLN